MTAHNATDPRQQLIQKARTDLANTLGEAFDLDSIQPWQRMEPLTPEQIDAFQNIDLARFIDSTLLRPEATAESIERLCNEALELRCAAVCVTSCWVELARKRLAGSVAVATVAGFPLGNAAPSVKTIEAAEVTRLGADEIDMVLNVGWLKGGRWADVLHDIAGVVQGGAPARVKVILETCLLTDEEKIIGCLLAQAAGAAFVKTSTGLQGAGATVEDVALMRQTVGPGMGVKAAGGIRDTVTARAMLAAGANRLGTSAALAIVGLA